MNMKKFTRVLFTVLVMALFAGLLYANSIPVMAAERYVSGFTAPIDAPDPAATKIYTAQDLYNVRNNLSGSYVLMNNIDLSSFNGGEWVPIGNYSSRFRGTFDGQGYIINNLKITGNYEYAGLFGNVLDATIKNVGLQGTNININSSSGTVGGICGAATGTANINNCYNKGSVSAIGSSDAGGICGWFVGSIIQNCYNNSNVSISGINQFSVGGIYGRGTGDINNCYNTGNISISSSNYSVAGGICGRSGDMIISACYNTGNVSVASDNSSATAGGICGDFSLYNGSRNICFCYNNGNISASSNSSVSIAGGICGNFYVANTATSNIGPCYNIGDISAYCPNSASSAGGICGEFNISGSGAIVHCYSISNLSTTYYSSGSWSRVGGICGNFNVYNDATYYIDYCYWNIDKCQTINGNAQTPKKGMGSGIDNTTSLTYAQMKIQSNFVGFQIGGIIWDINPIKNSGYPILRNFSYPDDSTYTVTYNANNGSNPPTDSKSPYTAGATVTVLGQGSMTRANYTFSGWNTAASGSGTSFATGSTFVISTNTTLYAQWTAMTSVSVPNINMSDIVGGRRVTITSATSGASIYYTTNGTTPTTSSTLYNGAFDITTAGTHTIMAIAVKAGMTNSGVSGYTFTLSQVSTPNITASDIIGGKRVTITSTTSGASIYYTTNGTTPTTSSTLYNGAFDITTAGTYTIKAIAVKSGMTNSGVLGSAVTVPPVATTYTVTYNANNGSNPPTDSKSPYTAGATVTVLSQGSMTRTGYTFAGWNTQSNGSGTSLAAGSTFVINTNTTLYAQWTAMPSVSVPNITMSDIIGGRRVTITSATSGASIYYTTDNMTPTTSSTLYNGAFDITIAGTHSIMAIAVKSGMTNSGVSGYTFTLSQVSTPNITASDIIGGKRVTITSTTSGASIYYTTNGPTPTTSSTLYNGAFDITTAGTYTIKAFAVKVGMTNSGILAGIYTIKKQNIIYGVDTYNFINTWSHFFNGVRDTYKSTYDYSMLDEYRDILYKELGSDADKADVIDYLEDEWKGSCFGMSAVLSLIKAGILHPNFFYSPAIDTYGLNYPKENPRVFSLINYYHVMQLSRKTWNNALKYSSSNESDNLRRVVQAMQTSNYPVVICFETIKGIYGHAIIGYNIIETSTDYQIKIWDPNDAVNNNIVLTIKKDFSGKSFNHTYTAPNYNPFIKCAIRIEDDAYYTNLETLLQNGTHIRSMSPYGFNGMMVASSEVEVMTILTTNYANFKITMSNGEYAVVQNSMKTSGNLNISLANVLGEEGYELRVRFTVPNLANGATYTVEPTAGQTSKYKTSLYCDNEQTGYFSKAETASAGKIIFGADGSVLTDFSTPTQTTLSSTTNNSSDYLYTLTSSGVDTSIKILPSNTSKGIYTAHSVNLNVSASGDYNSVNCGSVAVDGSGVKVVEEAKKVNIYSNNAYMGMTPLASATAGHSIVFYSLCGTPIDAITDIPNGTVVAAPQDPIRDGYIFKGWYTEREYINEWSFSNPITEDKTLYAKWDEGSGSGYPVTGKVISVSGDVRPATVVLIQNGAAKYTTQTNQNGDYVFNNVAPGNYKLVITKTSYLSYTKNSLAVNQNIAYKNITLVPGDIDGDGHVSYNDFLKFLENYNKQGANIANRAADINGDGYVDYNDFITFLSGYGKAAVIEP